MSRARGPSRPDQIVIAGGPFPGLADQAGRTGRSGRVDRARRPGQAGAAAAAAATAASDDDDDAATAAAARAGAAFADAAAEADVPGSSGGVAGAAGAAGARSAGARAAGGRIKISQATIVGPGRAGRPRGGGVALETGHAAPDRPLPGRRSPLSARNDIPDSLWPPGRRRPGRRSAPGPRRALRLGVRGP
jgi:type IV secretion system protein TrbL